MAPHAGIIITVSVLVAAGIAAYENPQIREWVEKSSQKVAMAFRSLGDDIKGKKPPAPRREDPSMREDLDEKAEQRRRQAREEVMQRGRLMEERNKKRKISPQSEKRTPSFDELVDEDGKLKPDVRSKSETSTTTTAEPQATSGTLRERRPHRDETMARQSETSLIDYTESSSVVAVEPWESQYEQEMRRSWNISLPDNRMHAPSSHASESLIDLTPTTEDFPDPDYSVLSDDEIHHAADRPRGLSMTSNQSSHTLSDIEPNFYYARPGQPSRPLEPRRASLTGSLDRPESLAASVAGSEAHVVNRPSRNPFSDDEFSELGDGVGTPSSTWTDVGSSVSEDFRH